MKNACLLGLFVPLFALASSACDSESSGSSSSGAGGDTSSTAGSGGAGSTSSSGGAGSTSSSGGAGGMAGSGGAGGGSANASYSAYYWPGGLDHILLWKADTTNNRCFEVHIAWPYTNSPGFNVTLPAMWGVVNAMVTDNAQDCAPNANPMGQTFSATSAMGTADWMVQPGMYAPCFVDFQLSLAFAGAPGWVPPTELLDATMVTVQGGCI